MLQADTLVTIQQLFKFADFKDPRISAPTGTVDLSNDSCKYQSLGFVPSEVTIDSSWDNITQTATIVIPFKYNYVIGFETDPNTGESMDSMTRANDLTKPYISLASPKVGYSRFPGLDGSGNIGADSDKIDSFDLGFRLNPLINVGDHVSIELGYIIRNNIDGTEVITRNTNNINKLRLNDKVELEPSDVVLDESKVFYGYISKIDITNDGVVLSCEDEMYYYNRARVPNKTYHMVDKKAVDIFHKSNPKFYVNPKGYSLNSAYADMLHSIPCIVDRVNGVICGTTASGIQNITELPVAIAVSAGEDAIPDILAVVDGKYNIYKPGLNIGYNIDTDTGDIELENTTIGGVFQKIKDTWETPTYISNKQNDVVLYSGRYVYKDLIIETGSTTEKSQSQYQRYIFGENIIDSNLNWQEDKDTPIGCLVKTSTRQEITTETTKRGKAKKITKDITQSVGDSFGTVYTFIYMNTTAHYTDTELVELKKRMYDFGKEQLAKVSYTGYFGSFTVFGYPYVRFGDVISIEDPNFPERTGTYYVKRVETTMNHEIGLIQEITLDYKILNTIPTYKK